VIGKNDKIGKGQNEYQLLCICKESLGYLITQIKNVNNKLIMPTRICAVVENPGGPWGFGQIRSLKWVFLVSNGPVHTNKISPVSW
jgi:hypothetical protein